MSIWLHIAGPCALRCLKVDGVMELSRKGTKNFSTANWHDFTEQREYESRFAVGDALGSCPRTRRQDDLGFDIRGDAQSLKHFLDIRTGCPILRIGDQFG